MSFSEIIFSIVFFVMSTAFVYAVVKIIIEDVNRFD